MNALKNVRRFARLTALGCMALAAGVAAAQEGDATPNSRRPVVGIVNPGNGVVTAPMRVQVRVFSPLAANDTTVQPIGVVTLQYQGPSNGSVTLSRNSKYGSALDSGVWEGALASPPLNAGGAYTLRASATNASGTVWSGPVSVTVNAGRGDGNLLVRDNADQLCSDCHTHKAHSSEATGPKYGSWYAGCRTCHQPHSTTNASLIATQITPPAVNGILPSSQVVFSNRRGYMAAGGATNPSLASYANGDKTGICQVCHTRTTAFLRDGTLVTHNPSSNCGSCHAHSQGLKASCSGCHGTSTPRTPVNASVDSLLNYAPPVSPTTTAAIVAGGGAHLAHVNQITWRDTVIPCSACHLNYVHGDGDVDLGWGPLTIGIGAKAVVPTPAAGATTPAWVIAPTCTNYCHGASLADGFTPTKVLADWTATSMTCGSCHGNPPAIAPHNSSMTACAGCHPTGYSLTTVNKTNHIDGTVDTVGGCTNCHGTAGRLGSVANTDSNLESAPPAMAGPVPVGAVANGGHLAHLDANTYRANPLLCTDCHLTNSHLNGQADVAWGALATTGGVSPTPATGSVGVSFQSAPNCTNYCHGASLSGGNYTTAVWTGTSLTCASCHATGTSLASGSHGLHVADSGYKGTTYGCVTCHDNATNTTLINKALHIDGLVNTAGTTFSGGSCATNYCHSNGTEILTAGEYTSVSWGGSSSGSGCMKCHGKEAGGIAGAPWYTNVPASRDTANSHQAHVAAATDCVDCHATTVQASGALIAGGTHHIDTIRDVSGAGIGSYDEVTETCSNISCHGGKSAQWGATLGCNGCHGAVANRTPVAGADTVANLTSAPPFGLLNETLTTQRAVGGHIAHANQITLHDNAMLCSECHSGAVGVHNGVKNVAFGALAMRGGKTPAWNTTTQVCSNTYCHAPGGAEAGGTNRTPIWNAGVSQVACGTCHGAAPRLSVAAGENHPQNTNCGVCHGTGYATGGLTAAVTDTHINGWTNAASDKPNNGCTACHGTLAGVTGAAVLASGASFWNAAPGYAGVGVDTNGATSIAIPSVGAHDAHVRPAAHLNSAVQFDCSICHGPKPPDGDTTHANGAVLLGWNVPATSGPVAAAPTAFNAAWEAAPNCTNYCHSNANPVGGAYAAPAFAWNSAAGNLACTSCHSNTAAVNNQGLSWRHNVHVDVYTTYTCDECHAQVMGDNSKTSITTPANHVRGTHTVNYSTTALSASINESAGTYNGTSYTCASTYCHSAGVATASPFTAAAVAAAGTPVWNAAWNSGNARTCAWCHGGPSGSAVVIGSTSGSAIHTGHVNNAAVVGQNYTCADCHSTVVAAGNTQVTSVALHVNGVKEVAMLARGGQSNGTYNATTKSCATSYCHSSGQSTPAYVSIAWNAAAIGCNGCHGVGTAAGAPNYTSGAAGAWNANSHFKHTLNGADTTSCQDCHSGYVAATGTAIPVGTTHTNGVRNVAFAAAYNLGTATYNATTKTCANVSCHGAGAPQWGATLGCNACHGAVANRTPVAGADTVANLTSAPPFGLLNETLTTQRAVGGHIAHANQITLHDNAMLCSECHSGAVGVHNGVKNVAFGALAMRGGKTPAWNTTTQVCSNTYCHAPGGAEAGGTNRTPIWNAGVSQVACGTCHGAAPRLSVAAGENHPQNTNCGVCHGTGYATGGLTAAVTDTHINGWTNAASDKPNNGCTACHGTLAGLTGAAVLASGASFWNAAPGYAGVGVDTNGATSIAIPSVGAHDAHVRPAAHLNSAVQFDCSICHGPKPPDGDTTHANGAVLLGWNVPATSGPVAAAPTAFNAAWEAAPNCTNYCHSNANPVGGAYAAPAFAWNSAAGNLACTSCHSNTAAVNNQGLSWRHNVHVDVYTTYTCDECHAQVMGDNSKTSITTPANHVRGTHTVNYSTTALSASINESAGTYNGTSYTCASTYCHSAGVATASPFTAAAVAAAGTPVWNAAWNSGNARTCAWCHGGPSGSAVVIGSTSGSAIHTGHVNNAAVVGQNYTCADCHSTVVAAGNTQVTSVALHVNGVKEVAMLARGGQSNGTYNATTKSCATSYCHSSGQSTPAYVSIAWNAAAIGCNGCHGVGTAAGAPNYTSGAAGAWNANSHFKHTLNGADTTSCQDCHSGYVAATGTAIPVGTTHTNGVRNVAFAAAYNLGTATYNATTKTCANVSCHGAGAPQWGATLGCNACHGAVANRTPVAGADTVANLTSAPPFGLLNETLTTQRAVGGHIAHANQITLHDNAMLCSECHSGAVGVHNGVKNVVFGALAARGGKTPAWNTTTQVCSNTYCHAPGGTEAGGTNRTPIWNAGVSQVACGTCHGAAPRLSVAAGENHPQNTNCGVCHGTGYATGGLTAAVTDTHINGWTNAASDKPNNGCTACHGTLAGVTGAAVLASGASFWNAAPGYAGVGVDTNGATSIAIPSVGAHDAHVRPAAHLNSAVQFDCSICHGPKPPDGDTTHANGAVLLGWNVPATSGPVAAAPTAFNAAWEAAPNCTNYCHSNANPVGGAYAAPAFAWNSAAGNLACTSCHSNTAAVNNQGLSWRHNVHVDVYTTYTCDECHAQVMGDNSKTSITTPANHVRGTHTVNYSTTALSASINESAGTYNGTSYTCASTYCHSAGVATASPFTAAAVAAAGTPVWNAAWNSGNARTCAWCHGGPSGSAVVIGSTSGSAIHTGHVNNAAVVGQNYTCADCHSTVVAAGNTQVTSVALHVNGVKEVAMLARGGQSNGTYNATTKSCATSYCHSSGQSTPAYVSIAWNAAAIGCNGCHGVGTAAGAPNYTSGAAGAWNANSHFKHTLNGADTTSCQDCHSGYVAATGTAIPVGTTHTNGVRNVAFAAAYNLGTATYNATTKTCANVSCHGAGAPQWGATLGCNACHGAVANRTPVAGADTVANLTSAPPFGLLNETLTTQRAVGGHIAHANQITLHDNAMLCSECHSGAVGVHNGVKNVVFGALAARGGKTPAWNTTTQVCSNTYCHAPGGTEAGGTNRTPIWNAGVSQVACGTCHGAAPRLSVAAGENHPQNTNCGVCHGTGYATGGLTAAVTDTHINGWTNAASDKPNNGCTACHGTLAGVTGAAVLASGASVWNAAPGYAGVGVDTNGSTSIAIPSVGAHDAHVRPAAHLNSAVQFDCSICHGPKPPDGDTTHANGAVLLGWNVPATSGPVAAAPTAFNAAWEAAPNCTNYCHSNANPVGGAYAAPAFAWNSAAGNLACTSCHSNTAAVNNQGLSWRHNVHVDVYTTYTCDECHAQVMGDNSKTSITTPANHVRGTHTVNYSTTALSASINESAGTYNGTSYTCASTYCHSAGVATASPFTAAAVAAAGTPVWNAAWNSGNARTCAWCHGGPSGSAVVIGSTSGSAIHTGHVNNAAVVGQNYTCADCHSTVVAAGNTQVTSVALHVNGVKEVAMLARGGQSNGTYNATTKSCATSYCHSSGQSTPAYVSIAWNAAAIGCNGCHGVGTAAGAPNYTSGAAGAWNANSHFKHTLNGADTTSCQDCHSGYVAATGTAIPVGTTHTNGVRNVAFAAAYNLGTATYNATTKTCANVSCHGAGAPQWGATLGCNACHGAVANRTPVAGADTVANLTSAPPFGLLNETLTTQRAVGGHIAHANQITLHDNAMLCSECHSGAVGVHNGVKNVAFGALAMRGGKTPAWNTTTQVCSNTYCHAPGGAEAGGTNRTPIWNAGVSQVACGTCHGAAPRLSVAAGENHPQNTNCGVCHGTGYATGGLTAAVTDTHINGWTNAASDKPNNGCTACHGTLAGLTGAAVLASGASFWNAAPGYAGVGVDTNGATSIAIPSVGAHDAHVRPAAHLNSAVQFDCSICHGPKPPDGDTTHANGAVLLGWNVPATSGPVAAAPTAFNAAWEAAPNCTNYCHSNANPVGGAYAAPAFAWNSAAGNLACTSCHSNTAAVNNQGLSWRHNVHVDVYTTYTCDECHAQVMGDNSKTSITTPANHVRGTHTVNYSTTALSASINESAGTYNGTSYTCASTYCHSAGVATASPFTAAAVAAAGTPVWNAAWNSGNARTCAWCHGGPSGSAVVIGSTSGSAIHTGHVNNAAVVGQNYTCADCHSTVVAAGNTQVTSVALHVNGVKEVAMLARGGQSNGTYNATTKSCATSYCHSSGQSTPAYVSIAWNAAAIGCNGCHGVGTAAGAPNYTSGAAGAWNANSHFKHTLNGADTTSCQDCHSGYVAATGTAIPVGTTHTNGVRNVAFAAAYNLGTATYNATTKTCANVSCHGAGAPQWGATLGCNACHGAVANRTPVAGADTVANLTSAPPFGLLNETLTTQRAVGGHIAHANQITLHDNAMLCSECHSGAVGVHNGVKNVVFGALAARGGKTPAWNTTTQVCSNTYCHAPGGTEAGGTNRTPIWNAGVSQVACGTCHGAAPPVSALVGQNHPQNTTCVNCHGTGYATGGVTVGAKTTHLNGWTNAASDKPNNGCTACHGTLAGVTGAAVAGSGASFWNAAPGYGGTGVDTTGATSYTVASVGAHDAHLRPSLGLNSASPFDCSICHGPKPADGDTTHANATVLLGWNVPATSGPAAATPTAFNVAWEAAPNCTNYCHSNANPVGGAYSAPALAWNSNVARTCTSCHTNTAAVNNQGLSWRHNVHIDVYTTYTCDECHAQVMANDSKTVISTPANHVRGTHTVNYSTTALSASINESAGTYNGTTYTCASTYCHSAGVATASPFTAAAVAAAGTPAWNTASWNSGNARNCTWCHGGPTASAVVIGSTSGSVNHTGHVNNAAVVGQNYTCADCHSTVVAAGNAPLTSVALHVNGVKEVSMLARGGQSNGTYNATTKSCATSYCHSSGQSTPGYVSVAWNAAAIGCNGCHGVGTTAGGPNYPSGPAGAWNANSHAAHTGSGSNAASCEDCHSGYVAATGTSIPLGSTHTNGVRNVAISSAYNAGTATYNATSKTCANITCHGAAVQWGGPPMTCTSCHGITGADVNNWAIADGTPSKISTAEWNTYGHGTAAVNLAQGKAGIDICRYCHDWNAGHGVATNPFRLQGASGAGGAVTANSFNAALNAGNGVCWNCHGTGSTGVDPDGSAATAYLLKTSTHKIDSYHYGPKHTAATDGGERCWDCHDPHGDGTNLAMIGSDTLRAGADPYGLTGTRSTTSAILTSRTAGNYAKTTTPFTGICQVCHTATIVMLASGLNQAHFTNDCMTCHGHDQTTVNDAFKGSGECIQCHATAKTGPLVPRRAIVSEFSQTWSHKASATNHAVTNADCVVCHMEGNSPADPVMSGVHGDGYINLRDPDTGSNIQGVYWTGTDAGGYTSTTTYLTFTQFSRNLGSKTLEAAVQAIQINQCLKCHDANGAASTLARVPGAPNGGRPFNTTLPVATYTGSGVTAFGSAGNVTDINASFAVTNSSYHPVRGKQNNWYSKLTRMAAPWNSTTRIGTAASTNSWGDLISCWDCHAPNGTGSTVTLTSTVTAHGGATTIRGTATYSGSLTATPVVASAVKLCIVCHAGYDTSTGSNHGAGSALSGNTNGTMTTYLQYACNKCHASSYGTAAVRPVRAQDSHGTNALPAAGTKTSRWATDPRPYAFIRNTGALSNHQPLRVSPTVTYTPNCVHLSEGQCTSRTANYTVGGTY